MSDRYVDKGLAAQARRVNRYWSKFEETGEERWLDAALEADRLFLRMRERVSS